MKKMQVVTEPCSGTCINFQLLFKINVNLKKRYFITVVNGFANNFRSNYENC